MRTVTAKRRGGSPAEKTPRQMEKERRALAMWDEYRDLLTQNPMRSKCELRDYLKGKYGITSNSGFYTALNRGRTLFLVRKP
ncbi:MAG: hypothetical protein K2G52_06535 [Muribaculaceae bacterium]|nr:hypothetical protein [Muribaculaceae bacterium]